MEAGRVNGAEPPKPTVLGLLTQLRVVPARQSAEGYSVTVQESQQRQETDQHTVELTPSLGSSADF